MIRRMPPALRRLMARLVGLAAIYLIFEAPFLFLENGNFMAPLPSTNRPGRLLLIMASVVCGARRVMGYHPEYAGEYKRWLELTPWTSRKPLPLGPVAPTWGDGLFMATAILLSAIQPEPRSMQLLCVFLMSHLLALLPTLWLGSGAIGYTTAAGLGLVVRLFNTPVACLVAATFVYLIAYEGLRRSLEKFPWQSRHPQPSSQNVLGDQAVDQVMQVGWPHGQMLAEVRDARPISRLDALLGCMLLSWWIDCLASLITDPQKRLSVLGFVSVATLAAPYIRLMVYRRGYAAPLSLWARIRLFKPIVPGYDRVFIGPVCSLLARPNTLALQTAMRAPLDVCLSIACGMIVLVALLTPPSLRRWRLTGAHRMVRPSSIAEPTYVQVG
jgi:hypothetical protein